MTDRDTFVRQLIELGQELVARGLVLGSGGNLSYRDGDRMFITRSGALLHQLLPEDFLPVPLDQPYQRPETTPRPSTETPMHRAAYFARPDAHVIVHCHPVNAIAWAMQGAPLPAVTPDFTLYLGAEVPTLPYFLPGSQALAQAVAQALVSSPAVLLGNHGVLVTGDTVPRARLRLFHIDETAEICLKARAAGVLRPLQPDEIAEVLAIYGGAKG
ncbi:MAG TPA: class II aldolase/adducin family protein [Anaerolineae bacterium]|nr:class II aldolase/adducin family protein [Anaerolineae bacterium]